MCWRRFTQSPWLWPSSSTTSMPRYRPPPCDEGGQWIFPSNKDDQINEDSIAYLAPLFHSGTGRGGELTTARSCPGRGQEGAATAHRAKHGSRHPTHSKGTHLDPRTFHSPHHSCLFQVPVTDEEKVEMVAVGCGPRVKKVLSLRPPSTAHT